MKFRKKPVVIEAFPVKDICSAADKKGFMARYPSWLASAIANGTIEVGGNFLMITTLEGSMIGEENDWLIRGIKGEVYPCKPDIFSATYEPA